MPAFDVAEAMTGFYGLLAEDGWTNPVSEPDEWRSADEQFEILIVHVAGSCQIRYRRTVHRHPGEANDTYYERRKAVPWNSQMRAYGGTSREFIGWLARTFGTISIYVASMSLTAVAPGE